MSYSNLAVILEGCAKAMLAEREDGRGVEVSVILSPNFDGYRMRLCMGRAWVGADLTGLELRGETPEKFAEAIRKALDREVPEALEALRSLGAIEARIAALRAKLLGAMDQ